MLAPLPRWATTTRPAAISGATCRQGVRDVFVGQAVEAVAADAVVVEPARQGVPVGDLGVGAVERGIEARDLGQLGPEPGDRADAGEIVRLVQRRERHERGQLLEHRWTHPHRPGVVDAAMHHPMADADQRRVTELLAQPAAEHAEELGVA